MGNEDLKNALAPLFCMIARRMDKAQGVARAAQACAESGNYHSALKILLDVEEPANDVTTLLNAICLIRREMSD